MDGSAWTGPRHSRLPCQCWRSPAIVVLFGNGIHASIDAMRAEAATDRAEAAADRRARQAAMDTFRQEMRALAVRQAGAEGRLESLPEQKAAAQ